MMKQPTRRRKLRFGASPLLALLAAAALAETPPGVEQILPRGGIPAVFAPEFVPAERAKIPDDAWVLGVVNRRCR